MLPTHHERRSYMVRLSQAPILICILAFAKSTVYRLLNPPAECKSFGWYSSSSGEFNCDHKSLDSHAVLALLWLAVFAIQVNLLSFGFKKAHRFFGKLGFVVALLNVGGIFRLAIHEALYPMEKTDRPHSFTPFMFLVGIKLSVCLFLSMRAIVNKDYEDHMLWIFRGFVTTFTTPIIRAYPALLRMMTGDDCFQAHRDKFVMEAMFVAEVVCCGLFYLAQKNVPKNFWDIFAKLQVLTFVAAAVKQVEFASEHGSFLVGVAQCALDKDAVYA